MQLYERCLDEETEICQAFTIDADDNLSPKQVARLNRRKPSKKASRYALAIAKERLRQIAIR